MKRNYGYLFAAGALAALLAGIYFGKQRTILLNPVPAAPTSSDVVTTVSPGAAAGLPPSSTAAAPGPAVRAEAAMDLTTGKLLYADEPDLRWPLASITKLMTAEIIASRMDPAGIVTFQKSDFTVGSSALTANLQPGDQFRARDLLKVMLLPSSNEAAEAFARTYGRANFLAAMNTQAATWGLSETHFDDPSGLSAADQSTPRDLLNMARDIYLAHPEIFAITDSRSVTVEELSTGTFKTFASTNDFAGMPDFVGGKTGTTPEAGDNLLSIFSVHGTPVAITVFGAADRYAATRALLQLVQ